MENIREEESQQNIRPNNEPWRKPVISEQVPEEAGKLHRLDLCLCFLLLEEQRAWQPKKGHEISQSHWNSHPNCSSCWFQLN